MLLQGLGFKQKCPDDEALSFLAQCRRCGSVNETKGLPGGGGVCCNACVITFTQEAPLLPASWSAWMPLL